MQFDRREKVPSLCRQRERPFYPLFLKIIYFHIVAQFWGPFRYALCQVSLEFLYTPLCHKMRVKTKHQNENFHFSYRCTISPPPVYALFRYLLCLFITPLCYGLRFKNDSSWRNSSHLPIAQNRGVKRNTFWKIYTFFKKWAQDSRCELRSSSPRNRTKWGAKRKCFFENFSEYFWENKKPGTKGYHMTSRWSASLCGKLLRPAIWWFHITSLGSNVPRCSVTTKSFIRRFLGSFSCACIIAIRCSLVNSWWNLFRYLWLWRHKIWHISQSHFAATQGNITKIVVSKMHRRFGIQKSRGCRSAY